MTYDSNRNILFIHIPKNAGKSIEVSLGLISEDEAKKYQFRSLINRLSYWLLRKTGDSKVRDRLFGTLDRSICSQHLSLQEIHCLELIGKNQLKSVTNLAVVRNPFERAVSTFKHFNQTTRYSPKRFLDFWKRWDSTDLNDHNQIAHRRRQVDFLRNTSGQVITEHLLRFENLESDFKKFANEVLGERLELAHIGASKKTLLHDFYDEPSRKWIAKRFEEDFDCLGYSTNNFSSRV